MKLRRSEGGAQVPAWADAQPSLKALRSKFVRRVAITGAGITLTLVSALLRPSPRLLWNASASAPIGLYAVTPRNWADVGEMVVARPPERFRQLAAERRYLPLNVPLLKHVAAAAGDKVCARRQEILINERPVARRRKADGRGRPMPVWSGCIRLHGRELFLLGDGQASFDGRYFGVTEGKDIIGNARLLWRR